MPIHSYVLLTFFHYWACRTLLELDENFWKGFKIFFLFGYGQNLQVLWWKNAYSRLRHRVHLVIIFTGLLSATETAHGIIRVMRRFMPVCWEIDSARSITVRGFPFTHPEVYQGFIASIVWILIFSFLLYLSTRSKKSSFLSWLLESWEGINTIVYIIMYFKM